MGMNFSPMYQPVSTKTIKADGDLNINPYDLLATDVKCDTVEASEFVGGVGNFESALVNTLSMPCSDTNYVLAISSPVTITGETTLNNRESTTGSIPAFNADSLFRYTTPQFNSLGDPPIKLIIVYDLKCGNGIITIKVNNETVEEISYNQTSTALNSYTYNYTDYLKPDDVIDISWTHTASNNSSLCRVNAKSAVFGI